MKKIFLVAALAFAAFLFTSCEEAVDYFSRTSSWAFYNRSFYEVTVTPRGDSVPNYNFVLRSGESKNVTWYGVDNYYSNFYFSPSSFVDVEYDYFSKTIYFKNRW